MDGSRFDTFARGLAGRRNRRALIASLPGLALADPARRAAAKKRKRKPPCLPAPGPLQAAVNGAAPGATVRLCAGVFPGLLVVDKDLTILGAGAGKTILSGEQAGTVLTVAADRTVVVRGLTITGGEINGSSAAGGVDNSGTLTLAGCALRDNFSYAGGGAWNRAGARLTLDATTVADNYAYNSGGGILNEGDLVVRNGSIVGSTQQGDGNRSRFGGGLSNTGTATFAKGTKLTGNVIDGGGGGTGSPDGAGILNDAPDGVTLATTGIVFNNTKDGSINNCRGSEPVANCREDA